MSGKAIFSEGIAVTPNRDGTYTVRDVATGQPIAGVTGCTTTYQANDYQGGRLTTELEIEVAGVRCHVKLETETA